MDTGLDENEAELGVLVFSVALKVLTDSDGLRTVSGCSKLGSQEDPHLLDQHVQVLWNLWGEAYDF